MDRMGVSSQAGGSGGLGVGYAIIMKVLERVEEIFWRFCGSRRTAVPLEIE
jgi:hypothetical protein